MRVQYLSRLLYGLAFLWASVLQAQNNNANCVDGTVSGSESYSGTVFINYGATTNSFTTKNRTTGSLGESFIGPYLGQTYNGVAGFYSRFLLPPSAPLVYASEGDLKDRIQVNWVLDPLSPSAEQGFNIYRDGAFIDHVEKEVRVYIDFNVQAGQFYNYEVSGVNGFGEGSEGSSLGFLNPNGVITGQVRTFSGNPVLGAGVTLTPTLGNALQFTGDDVAFAEFDSVLLSPKWSVSCWVKIGAGNNNGTLLDFGSNAQKNWWLTTNGTAKGIRFSVGNGPGTPQSSAVNFSSDPDGWHHIAATYSGASLLLYLDGKLSSTLTPAPMTTDTLPLFFGRKSGAMSNYFNGQLDEVRIFNRQLSQTEINQYKNRTVNSDAEALAAYWKFDEGIGSKAYDISPKRLKTYLCGPEWSADRPTVVNGAVTDASGFYKIDGINYGSGTTFTATPSKTAYDNYALEFNSVNSNYAVLTDSVLPSLANAAIELRLQNFENAAVDRTVLANQSPTGTNFFQLRLNNGTITVRLGAQDKTFGTLGSGYQHLVLNLKKNGGNIDATLYKNGVAAPTQTYTGALPDFGPQTWYLGARKTASAYDQFFSGLVDEVAFYDTTLTVAEVQLNQATGADATNQHLRSWFPLNESQGASLEDIGPARTGFGAVQGALWSTVTGISASFDHEFQPDKRLVTLNPSNTSTDLVDFTDLSTVTVSGYVRFDGTDCFAKNVEILVNGESASPKIMTDSTGKFVADFEPGTTARLSPILGEHTFSPASWQVRNLNAPVAGILFRDMTKRSITGFVNGGLCKKGLLGPGETIRIKVATPGANPCLERTITLTGDADGGEKDFTLDDLPPRELVIGVNFSNPTTFFDYFNDIGGQSLDLRDDNDTVEFNYIAPPQIEVVDGLPLNTCGDPMVQQLERYTLRFKVYQPYAGGNCDLDEAEFRFNNGLADTQPFDTLMDGGTMRYSFRAGEPNLAAPHLKTLTVTATQADSQAVVLPMPAVVLGQKSTGTTFATTMPQIPFVILRDPPGDASSAYIDQGRTSCNSVTLSAIDGNDNTKEYSISLGTETEILTGLGVAILNKIEIENTTTFGLTATLSDIRDSTMEVCISANQVIATNGADDLMGRDADIFVGGALNFDFGVTNILRFEPALCDYAIEKGIIAAPTGLATTYVFQRYDIVNQVIPNLAQSGLPTAAADIDRWNEILAMDDALQQAAVFEENISFTGGVTYEKSLTTERSESFSQTTEFAVGNSVANELGLTADGIGGGFNIESVLSYTKSKNTSTTEGSASTVGYVLNDDDIGDLFSVTVKRDKRYGTPVFTLVSGETSCPWEAPTQKRNFVSFSTNTTAVANVGSNAAALFTLRLGNESETEEEQTYTLSIGSNPLGAIVKAEGQQLTAAGLEFSIPAGQSLPVKLTIERGVLSYSYQDIEVILAASCEDGSVDGFSKSLFLDVEFVEPCSEVDIAFPMQNDVINGATGSTLSVTLDSYDKNDPDLDLIRIQYRPKFGDGTWFNIAPNAVVPKASLGPVSTMVNWNVGALTDGPYELRAITQCTGGNQQPGISTIINLRVEKQAPSLLGVPEPADGILSPGDEISITFNEEINCAVIFQADVLNNNNIGLYDTETGELIDAQISCFENKIVVVPNIQNAFIEGKNLRVIVDDIEDLAGNLFVHTLWEFFVNRSPLDLEGSDLDVTMYEGEEKVVLRNLSKVGGSIAAFEIAGTPIWANIYPNVGSLLPGEEVTITYKFDKTLPQGIYQDTIYFTNSQGDERVIIKLRVLCPPPDWSFDQGAYAQTMNLTAVLNIEGDFSEDEADLAAAFIDGQLRGSAQVKYLPSLDEYRVFMTVYGNADDQDKPIALEIWDASACLRYSQVVAVGNTPLLFEEDNVIGLLDDPIVLSTNSQVRRDIPLSTGWNWISFNLDLPDPSLNAALASLQHPQNDLFKSQGPFSIYSGTQWVGGLAAVNNTSMFQYRADQPDTIKMVGGVIDPASVQIPVDAGWNWIGYVPNYALPVSEALAGLTPLNGDIVKGQTAFAQYLAGFGWLGSLQFLEAPKGYLLKISNPGTLSYPANVKGNTVEARGGDPVANFWTVNPTQFEHSMTLVGMLSDGNQNATLATHELGAFAGNDLRGSATSIYIEPLQAHLFFLTTYANVPGEQLQFKLYNSATGTVEALAQQMFFASDLHQGTVEAPVPFTLLASGVQEQATALRFEVQPNPFTDALQLLVYSDREQDLNLQVSDATGRLVAQQKLAVRSGSNALRWDAGALSAGVYLIRLEGAGGTMVQKVIKQ
ncbi:MAG: T9SS type A sorting domain-containing protein [Saprospiraceae bacterium]|nr:T9SS type A sorting domain-containing protein [Saprospiraceae bacterium]